MVNKLEIKSTKYIKKFEESIHLLPDHKQAVAEELIAELSFMNSILEDLKNQVAQKGATHTFMNGKQEMRSQTPEFKSYMETTNRYKQYFNQLLQLYPEMEALEANNELEEFLEVGIG